MPDIALIQRLLSPDEKEELGRLQASGWKLLCSGNLSLPDEPFYKGLEVIKLPEKRRKQIGDEVFAQVIGFAEKEVQGKPVFDWLQVDSADFWNHAKFNAYYSLRYFMFELGELEEAARTGQKVLAFIRFPELEQGFSGESKPEFRLGQSQKENGGLNFSTLWNYGLLFLIRAILALFQTGKVRKCKHLLIHRPLNSIRNSQGEWRNPFMGDLLTKAGEGFCILNDLPPPSFRKKVGFSLEKRFFTSAGISRQLYSDRILLGGLLSGKVRRQVNAGMARLRANLALIEDNCPDLRDKMLVNMLRKELFIEKIYLLRYYAFRRAFARWKGLKSITATGENSGFTKCIFDAAHDFGIKRVGLQHGTIHAQHAAYCYTPLEVERGTLPDYSFTWGTHWSNLLVETGNYPPESLVLVGQPRTDWIMENADRSIQEISHLVDVNRPVLLFASQNIPDVGLREQIVIILFEVMKNHPDLQLLIKLHPREPKTGFYEPIAEKTGYHSYQIVHDQDLYYLLSVCSGMITYTSTVGAETVYFHKKLFIIDPLDHDFMKYRAEGVADLARSREEFEEAIRKAVAGNFAVDRTAYDRFIEKYSYKVDRKVADRCLAFLERL